MLKSSLNKKDTRPLKEQYESFILFLSAIGVIAIVFILAIAITTPSFYVTLGEI